MVRNEDGLEVKIKEKEKHGTFGFRLEETFDIYLEREMCETLKIATNC